MKSKKTKPTIQIKGMINIPIGGLKGAIFLKDLFIGLLLVVVILLLHHAILLL